jgi:hypothetical protein
MIMDMVVDPADLKVRQPVEEEAQPVHLLPK